MKSERERQISCDITYTQNLKYGRGKLIYKTETGSDPEKRLAVARGERDEGRKEVGERVRGAHLELRNKRVLGMNRTVWGI